VAALGRGKNRRRNDTAERAADTRAFAARVWPIVWRLGVAAAACAGLVVGGEHAWRWATTAPTFALRTVTVSGAGRAEAGEVSRLAGLYEGQNLFLLDVATAVKGAEAHPWVKKASLRRHFPSSVAVTVEEYEPAALVALGELYLLDRDGTPFKRLSAGDALDLPLVTGITREGYADNPEASAALFRQALSAIDTWEAASEDPDDAPSELRLRGGEMTVVTRAGVEVRVGREVTEDKLQRLSRVRRELARRGLSAEVVHLDNRARPGWVTVKTSTPALERRRESVQ
jgi:cell division protein FtsQ